MTSKKTSSALSALEMAKHWHRGQEYGSKPYIYHLEMVVNIAKEFGYQNDPLIMDACALHDTIEDCDVDYSTINDFFGEEVAEIVYCVTDELGRNRAERKRKTYPKIKNNWRAIVVKLCDRIANVRECIITDNQTLLQIYKNENKEFTSNLKLENTNELPLWEELDSLINNARL